MQPANGKQEQDQVVVTRQEHGTHISPEQSTRHPARRKTTKGKAAKSLGRRYAKNGTMRLGSR